MVGVPHTMLGVPHTTLGVHVPWTGCSSHALVWQMVYFTAGINRNITAAKQIWSIAVTPVLWGGSRQMKSGQQQGGAQTSLSISRKLHDANAKVWTSSQNYFDQIEEIMHVEIEVKAVLYNKHLPFFGNCIPQVDMATIFFTFRNHGAYSNPKSDWDI